MNNKLGVLLLITFSFQISTKALGYDNFQDKWGPDHPNLEEERKSELARKKTDEENAKRKYEFRLRVLQNQEQTERDILATYDKDYSFKYFPMKNYLKVRGASIEYHNSVLTDTQQELANLRPPSSYNSYAGFVKTLNYPPEVNSNGTLYSLSALDFLYSREVNGKSISFASYQQAHQPFKIANLRDSINENPVIFENINTLLNEEKKLLPYEKMGFLLEDFHFDDTKELLISKNLNTISLKSILTDARFYSLRETALNSLEQAMENFRRQGFIFTDLVNPSEISYSSSYNRWVISKIKFHKENLFSNWTEVERAIPERYKERLSKTRFHSPVLSCLSKYRKL